MLKKSQTQFREKVKEIEAHGKSWFSYKTQRVATFAVLNRQCSIDALPCHHSM